LTKPRVTPVLEDDSALVRVLEAHVETLKAEIRRRLAAAEARTAQETAKAEGAIAELSALIRIRASAAALGDGGSRQSRPRLAQAEWSPAVPHVLTAHRIKVKRAAFNEITTSARTHSPRRCRRGRRRQSRRESMRVGGGHRSHGYAASFRPPDPRQENFCR
jgi:hypothetical protein